MKLGTKSLLYGVHNIVWHPLTVYWAWKELYGRPNWREVICIIIHDWGYLGQPNMDGPEGKAHPVYASKAAGKLLGHKYALLCLCHSRHYAAALGAQPSKLC